jgi:hypothetical protein
VSAGGVLQRQEVEWSGWSGEGVAGVVLEWLYRVVVLLVWSGCCNSSWWWQPAARTHLLLCCCACQCKFGLCCCASTLASKFGLCCCASTLASCCQYTTYTSASMLWTGLQLQSCAAVILWSPSALSIAVVAAVCSLQTADCRLNTADCTATLTDYRLQTH